MYFFQESPFYVLGPIFHGLQLIIPGDDFQKIKKWFQSSLNYCIYLDHVDAFSPKSAHGSVKNHTKFYEKFQLTIEQVRSGSIFSHI